MDRYKVIESSDAENLERRINALNDAEGWKPICVSAVQASPQHRAVLYVVLERERK